eukprot:1182771-Prorocentrum_minimum.AAC.3
MSAEPRLLHLAVGGRCHILALAIDPSLLGAGIRHFLLGRVDVASVSCAGSAGFLTGPRTHSLEGAMYKVYYSKFDGSRTLVRNEARFQCPTASRPQFVAALGKAHTCFSVSYSPTLKLRSRSGDAIVYDRKVGDIRLSHCIAFPKPAPQTSTLASSTMLFFIRDFIKSDTRVPRVV